MKYKHINAAIHNFGHSFTSLMNYVDGDYVMDELAEIHSNGYDIEVDWLTGVFKPKSLASNRVTKSIGYWKNGLADHLTRHNVDVSALVELKFIWPAKQRKQMVALDNRGKSYRMYVNESK